MRLSHFFLPTLKEKPSEAAIVSHQLMLRAGMICQETSGIYYWLPLGARVLKKIENIIRLEQNAAGNLEFIMPTLQPADLWKESRRYDGYGKEMLRMRDRHDRELLYSPTNEEAFTDVFRRHIKSYKDLPLCLYQIQWKFRDEIRPRFGVMRGREFFMKDAYSFDLDADSSRKTYMRMMETYIKTFARMGLTVVPVRAENGPIGGDLSHEFQVIAETGESHIFYDKKFDEIDKGNVDVADIMDIYAMSEEMHDPANCPIAPENLRNRRGIEVGHIFYFGDTYTRKMGAAVTLQTGEEIFPHMGSYGIGVSRLVGAAIEANHDENGIMWPESIAPFQVGLINLKPGMEELDDACEDLYQKMLNLGIEVLYDDKKASPGVKFSTMDLIGLPWQVSLGPRGLKEKEVEIKSRRSGERTPLSFEEVMNFLSQHFSKY